MIHAFQFLDKYLLLDVESGALHEIDAVTFDILPDWRQKNAAQLAFAFPQHSAAEIEEAAIELAALCGAGALEAAEPLYEHTENDVVKAMCLHVSHDCNLRCGYCFAATGDFNTGRSMMDVETGKKALDFLVAHSGNRKNLEVDFFGGEPLMNFGVVKELVAYGRALEAQHGKTFKFTITTNGVGINDDVIAFCNREMNNVVLSLDGRRQTNDKLRKTPAGGGSFDLVFAKTLQFASSRNALGLDHYVRGTFTSENLDFAEDVLFLADSGFEQISIEPVVLPETSEFALKQEHLSAIFAEYERLSAAYIQRRKHGKWFNFFHFMLDLENAPCLGKRIKGCGAGNEYVAVTPEGDIYPCHQFVGNVSPMGNVHTGAFDAAVQKGYGGCNLTTKPQCRSCWAKYFCSGGCAANAYNFNGDIAKPYELACDIQKKRLECALGIYAYEAQEDDSGAEAAAN